MNNGTVLNHHSLPFANRKKANDGLLLFFKILKTCRRAGLKILLVDEDQDKSLMRLELTPGYFVNNWFSSAKKDAQLRDWCSFLRSLETRQPLFEMIDMTSISDKIEVGLLGEPNGKRVLLAAYHFQTFLISFSTLKQWLAPSIGVWTLDISDEAEVKNGSLLNLVDENSLQVHHDELYRRRNELLRSGKKLWANRQELLPNLTLLSNQIGTALQNWSAQKEILFKARDGLIVLELFCSKWQNGEYADYRHTYLRDLGLAAEVSGESKSVKDNPWKKKERMFWLDDGREVYCENHIKLPHGFRLHFFPDTAQKHIYVAYLGRHLTS